METSDSNISFGHFDAHPMPQSHHFHKTPATKEIIKRKVVRYDEPK